MRVKRSHHASVVLDGKIYTMGGYAEDDDDGDEVLDTVEVYDPQVDSWQFVASMPHGLYWHAAAAIDGKIYVTGGCGSPLDSVFVYDPQANAWTQLASMSTARRSHVSAVVDGKLYVFGGYAEGDRLSTAEVYDPASNSWAEGSSLTSGRSHSMAVAL